MSAKELERLAFFETLFKAPGLGDREASELLSLAGKFEKIEELYRKAHAADLIPKKIAVLSSYTTHHLLKVLKLFLYRDGLAPIFYEGEYDAIVSELMNPSSGIFAFKPEMLLLLTHHGDIKDYPSLFAGEAQLQRWAEGKAAHYQALWKCAAGLSGCQTFQTLFVTPLHRQLGNMEANHPGSRSRCLRLLESKLLQNKPAGVSFLDMDYLAASFGKERWFDDSQYFTSKQGFSLDAAALVCHALSRLLSSAAGKVRKCLVVDLDNTLWGGVVGDDGLEGINASAADPAGEAFLAFQEYLKALKERGVLLAVCSKNDEETAKKPFIGHPEMRLRLEDISCFVANWKDKAENIREIALRLNIGLDSLVFFDDNPFERGLVRKFLPDVEVVEVPEDPALYVRALEKARCFEWGQLSQEDAARTESYVSDERRRELETQSGDYEGYLKSLEMKAEVGRVGSMELGRFTQLINKSNQFNLRTQRYNEAAIEEMAKEPQAWAPIYISLADRFTNYGIISCLILKKSGDKAFIDTWVMSCRVLKRGVEAAAFNAILQAAGRWKCAGVLGEYLATDKNGMVRELLKEFGFKSRGADSYELKLSGTAEAPHLIQVEQK